MRHEDGIPNELRDVAERLRRERPEVTSLELDEVKLRVITRASRRESRRRPGRSGLMRSRLVSLALVVGLLGGGTGAMAASGTGPFKSSSSKSSAASSQYCPPRSQQPDVKKKPGPTPCGNPQTKK